MGAPLVVSSRITIAATDLSIERMRSSARDPGVFELRRDGSGAPGEVLEVDPGVLDGEIGDEEEGSVAHGNPAGGEWPRRIGSHRPSHGSGGLCIHLLHRPSSGGASARGWRRRRLLRQRTIELMMITSQIAKYQVLYCML